MKKLKKKIRPYLFALGGAAAGLVLCGMRGSGADPMAFMAYPALVGLLLSAVLPKRCNCGC